LFQYRIANLGGEDFLETHLQRFRVVYGVLATIIADPENRIGKQRQNSCILIGKCIAKFLVECQKRLRFLCSDHREITAFSKHSALRKSSNCTAEKEE
jgi:hypothetical protein